jgi:hypothetical protein
VFGDDSAKPVPKYLEQMKNILAAGTPYGVLTPASLHSGI